MKKPIVWLNGNRMRIETGHKTFDRQCRAILTGQQIGDAVISAYIRPYHQTECNGLTFPLGHLRAFDFEFMADRSMPRELRARIESLTLHDSLLLYKFFHYSSSRPIVHGYVATRDGHCLLKRVTNSRASSLRIIDEVAHYVCDDADTFPATPISIGFSAAAMGEFL